MLPYQMLTRASHLSSSDRSFPQLEHSPLLSLSHRFPF